MNHTPSRFLYIKWKAKSQGLLNIIWSIESAIYLCVKENIGRTIIISDSSFLCKSHSPQSLSTTTDLRKYYSFPNKISTPDTTNECLVCFDENETFYSSYSSNQKIGIITSTSRAKPWNLPLDFNIPHKKIDIFINKPFDLKELGYSNFNHLFYYGREPFINYPLLTSIKLQYNIELQSTAERIVKLTKKQCGLPFCVLHLRRGDMLNVPIGRKNCYWKHVKESSEISHIKRVLLDNLQKQSCIYIMTNGTEQYLNELTNELSEYFNVFTKHSFEDLREIDKVDNYMLFVTELCIAERSDTIVSNRAWGDLFAKHPNIIHLGPVAY